MQASPIPPGYELSQGGIALPTDLRASDALSDLKNPTAWLESWALGPRMLSGVVVSPQTSMGLSTYYDCIRLIAEDCAKLPLPVYERLERGRRQAAEHWLWPIVHDEFNDDMTAMTGRETLYAHALGWGNGYGLIQRDRSMTDSDGQPTGIYPIHPSRVQVGRNRATGQLQYEIGLDMGGKGQETERIIVQSADMIHIKGLGGDGICGYSVCRFAAESLGLSLAAQAFGAGFFGNSARAGGVLQHPAQLSDKALQHLKESFAQDYGGPQNAGKPMILEEGMQWSRMSIPPNEAQYLETREFQVLEICRWFRVQPHKVAELTNAHFANAEILNIDHVNDTLMPWLVRGEQELNRKLLAGTDYYVKHNVTALLRGDMAARSAYYKAQFSVAALSPNDIRELEELNPYEGGDEYFLQIQYAPVRKIVDGTASQPRLRPSAAPTAALNGHQKPVEELVYAP